MQSFATLLNAIQAAEEALGEVVTISVADGNRIEFSCDSTRQGSFLCTVDDGYLRYMEDGKLRIAKNTGKIHQVPVNQYPNNEADPQYNPDGAIY